MGVALQACDQLLWKRRWKTLDRQVRCGCQTGRRRCGALSILPAKITRLMHELLQTHPAWPSWNIEVICPQQGRQAQDDRTRRCLAVR